MLGFVIFACTAVVGLFLVLLFLFRKGTPTKSNELGIPGAASSDSERGNFGDIAKAGSLHEYLVDLHAQYGPLTAFWWGKTLTVSIASPQLFQTLSKEFNRPVEQFKLFEPLITPLSIQYANDSEGQERHKYLSASFQGDALYSYYNTLCDVVQETINKFSTLSSDDHININNEMFHLAMSAFLRTGFGETFRQPEELAKIRVAYYACWVEMEKRIDGLPPSAEREKLLEDNLQVMHDMVRQCIELRRRSNIPEDQRIFIDRLEAMDCSEEQKLADAVSFLVGGFHTTGNLLTWAIYYLASHPLVQEKVAEEARDVLGKSDRVTTKNMEQLTYIRQVVEESLRCSVLAPWAARYVDHDITLETYGNVYTVPAKTPIITALGVVLQDPVIWPDPEKFDPERFSDTALDSFHKEAFKAFGLSRRRCPGFLFARAESKIALSMLCRQFIFDLVPGPKITKVHGLVTHPSHAVEVTVQRR